MIEMTSLQIGENDLAQFHLTYDKVMIYYWHSK